MLGMIKNKNIHNDVTEHLSFIQILLSETRSSTMYNLIYKFSPNKQLVQPTKTDHPALLIF